MGAACGCDSEEANAANKSNTERSPKPGDNKKEKATKYDKDSKIVIIGGGPSGVHMASLLDSRGYTNIIILEKDHNIFEESKGGEFQVGKSHTIHDAEINNGHNDYENKIPVVHEMGTCYLHDEYYVIDKLVKKYDPDNKDMPTPALNIFNVADENDNFRFKKSDDERKIDFNKWAFREMEKTAYPKQLHWLPDAVTGIAAFVAAVKKYNAIHFRVFGKQKNNKKYGFLRQPKTDEDKELIAMTYLDFLEKNGLDALVPILTYSQTAQGYGTLYTLPAYYGLYWHTPELLDAWIDPLNNLIKESTARMLSGGFESLWKSIIKKHNLEIRYNTRITSINRYLNDETKQVEIKYKSHVDDNGRENSPGHENNTQTLYADIIIFAAGMHRIMDIIDDVTEQERTIFNQVKASTFVTTLYEVNVVKSMVDDVPAILLPNTLWNGDGELYGIRNSAKTYIGEKKYSKLVDEGKITKDRWVGYQFWPHPRQETIEGEKESEFFENKFKNALMRYKFLNNYEDIDAEENGFKVLRQEVWDYFPIWDIDSIKKGYPWIVKDEMQGKNKKSFYIGSSVSFESVLNVVEYNNEICDDYF